jgi:beta-lactamase class A
MRDQQLVAGLHAYLPADVAVASKTGDLPGLQADMALLERGDHWVSVAVVADDLGESATAVLPVFAAIGALAAERLDHSG